MKKIKKILITTLTVLLLTACGTTDTKGNLDDTADKGLEVIGQNLQWDPNKLVNEGNPIELEYWTWGDDDPVIFMAEKYEEIYPNVKINVVVQPWDDF